jgi:hypothetical protein
MGAGAAAAVSTAAAALGHEARALTCATHQQRAGTAGRCSWGQQRPRSQQQQQQQRWV